MWLRSEDGLLVAGVRLGIVWYRTWVDSMEANVSWNARLPHVYVRKQVTVKCLWRQLWYGIYT